MSLIDSLLLVSLKARTSHGSVSVSLTLDLSQRMKAENNGYKNKTVFWNAYKERSKQERPDLKPYEYTRFMILINEIDNNDNDNEVNNEKVQSVSDVSQ